MDPDYRRFTGTYVQIRSSLIFCKGKYFTYIHRFTAKAQRKTNNYFSHGFPRTKSAEDKTLIKKAKNSLAKALRAQRKEKCIIGKKTKDRNKKLVFLPQL